jgi:hypothetical protein
MAITKTIEIDVNTLQAVGGLDNLDKALKQVDKSAKSVDATFEEVYGDLKPLTARMGEAEDRLYELALAGQSASQEYKDLLASVGNYRRVQMQTDMVVDAAATTFDTKLGGALQGATSAFAGVQGAMALTGGQSEELEKALLKVQGAMALAEGVRGIREGAVAFKALGSSAQKFTIVQKAVTAGQWLWNTAMAANPIGAIIAAVVALIAAGVALTNYFMENSKAAKANAAAVELNRVALEKQSKTLESNSDAFDKKQKQELAMAKASGMSVEAIRKLELKLADEKIAYEKSQRAIAENTYEKEQNILASLRASGADDDVIKKQIENRNEAVKQYNKQNQDVKKALDEKADIQNRHLVEIKTAETSSAKDKSAKDKERRQKEIDDQKKQYEDAKKIAADAKIQNENAGKTELELLEDKFKKEKAILEKNKIDTNELEIKYWNERNGILLKQQEEEKKVKDKEKEDKLKDEEDKKIKDKEDREKRLEEEKKFNEELITAENNLQTAKRDAILGGLEVLQQFAGKSKAVALGILAIQKGLAIAEVISNASKGIAVSNANLATVPAILPPGVPNPAYPIAVASNLKNIAATKISAATSIATILAQTVASAKTTLGGGGGGGSAPANGGGGAAPAPSFNVVGNSGVNQIAQTLGNQQPVQAYVVANNVTTAQSLDRNIVQNASLG